MQSDDILTSYTGDIFQPDKSIGRGGMDCVTSWSQLLELVRLLGAASYSSLAVTSHVTTTKYPNSWRYHAS